jgi:hypothetical protein
LLAGELREAYVEWPMNGKTTKSDLRWYGEYLWRVEMPAQFASGMPFKVCATDAAGNSACADKK